MLRTPISNIPKSKINKKAILLDGDGGVISAFCSVLNLDHYTADFYISYNSADEEVNNRAKQTLSGFRNVHLYPTITRQRNAADITLAYILCAVNKCYKNVAIVHVADKV